MSEDQKDNVEQHPAQRKMAAGMDIGICVKTIANAAQTLMAIGNQYAQTNEPILHDIAEALWKSAGEAAKSVNTLNAEIGAIAIKYGVKQEAAPVGHA